MWTKAIEDAVAKTKNNLEKYGELFPHITQGSEVKHYDWGANTDWIEDFYSGMVWFSYEYDGDPLFLESANRQIANYRRRLEQNVALDHHDIGFLYCPSALADRKGMRRTVGGSLSTA